MLPAQTCLQNPRPSCPATGFISGTASDTPHFWNWIFVPLPPKLLHSQLSVSQWGHLHPSTCSGEKSVWSPFLLSRPTSGESENPVGSTFKICQESKYFTPLALHLPGLDHRDALLGWLQKPFNTFLTPTPAEEAELMHTPPPPHPPTPPPEDSRFQSLEYILINVASFGKRVFAGMIKDLEMERLSWITQVTLNAPTSVLIRDRGRFDIHTQRKCCKHANRGWVMWLQAKECCRLQKPEEASNGLSSRDPRDLPGGPMFKTLPSRFGPCLGSKNPHTSQSKSQNIKEKQYCHKCSAAAAAAAKSLQLCPTLCNSIDGSPPGSPVPGILQARTLEWVAISFSNAWKWKGKVKSLSRVRLFKTSWLQPTKLLCPWDFPGKSTGVGCHCLLRHRVE